MKITLIIIVLLSITLGYMINELINNPISDAGMINENQLNTSIKNITHCSNLSVNDTSYCLRNYIKSFYNYTIRNDSIKTIEDIKKNGGDCFDYSMLYVQLAKQLGFQSDYFTFKGHRIALIWNNDIKIYEYCTLDQLNIHCIKLE